LLVKIFASYESGARAMLGDLIAT